MKETVAIIGSHPRTRILFDWKRTDCDIWLFNEALSRKSLKEDPEELKQFQQVRRADAIFQMHVPAVWKNPKNTNDPTHYEWLKTQTVCDVYMQDQYPEVPKAIKYPLDEIVARFGRRFFSSSPEYAIALAIFKGYQRIEIYGIEMETNTEWAYQRVGMAYWSGVADGLGIQLDTHMSLFDAPLYGYDANVSIDPVEFEKRIAQLRPLVELHDSEYKAAQAMVKRQMQAVAEGDNSDEIIQEVAKLNQAGFELGQADGALQENIRYQKKAETMREVSGDVFFSRQEFESSMTQLQKRTQDAQSELESYSGQMEILHRQLVGAAKGSPKRNGIFTNYQTAMLEFLKKENTYSILYGAANENLRYMRLLDPFIRAAGGKKGEAVMLEAMKQEATV